MTQKTSVQIATDLLEIMRVHEESWTGNTYAKGHWWTDNVQPYLRIHGTYSAFAAALEVYHQWYNDIQNVCHSTIDLNRQ